MRVMFTALLMFSLLKAAFAFADEPVIQVEYVPENQYWELEWLKGFDPEKPLYKGTPFDWSLTRLTTDFDDPSDWSIFSAGCNGAYRQQYRSSTSTNPDSLKWGIGITQTGCLEAVGEGEDRRELVSRYSEAEVTIIGMVNFKDEKPPISLDGSKLTWLDEQGAAIAKFRKIHPLADGHTWEVDRDFHSKSDAFYDRNYTPRIRFFDKQISFYVSCENQKLDVVLDENSFKLLERSRPKICRELIYKEGELIEKPTETESYQPFQTAYEGLSKAVRFERYSAKEFAGNRYNAEPDIRKLYAIKFFDEDDNVVLQLTPVSNKKSSYKKARQYDYKAQWQLTGPQIKNDGPILNLEDGTSTFGNSCDDNIWTNVWSARENELAVNMGHRTSDRTRKPCDMSDPKYNPHQQTLERIVKQTSRHVVDGDNLYLANDDLDILGRFIRVSHPESD